MSIGPRENNQIIWGEFFAKNVYEFVNYYHRKMLYVKKEYPRM